MPAIKKDTLPYYNEGSPVTLTASKTTLAPLPSDSLLKVLALTWTSPNYGVDPNTYKYIIEIDSAGKNFSKPVRREVIGKLTDSLVAKDLNSILVDRGYAFGVPVDMDVRVISSYGNNNEQKISNTVRIKMTPYKVPPKVPIPTSNRLFLTGDASVSGWVNPVPAPNQEFARLDETTWAGVFQLTGGKEFLVLAGTNTGDWSQKYALQDNTVAGINAGGNFGFHKDGQPAPDVYTQNFKGPAASGMYKIVLDFQQGKFSITPFLGTLPTTGLFITGDAVPSGWSNPVPAPAQQLTRINSSVWEITLPFTGGKEFLVLAGTNSGDWSKKFALKDNSLAGINTGGEFGYHQDNQPAPDVFTQNFKGPATSGTYKLTLNFAAPTTSAGASGRFTFQ